MTSLTAASSSSQAAARSRCCSEVVASSILFVYEGDETRPPDLNLWLIDFAKTELLPEGERLDHREPWRMGNREDGYLAGLDSLIGVWQALGD